MFLVVGATGDLGSRIVHQLVRERGVSVRCLVRAGADLTTLPDAGGSWLKGTSLSRSPWRPHARTSRPWWRAPPLSAEGSLVHDARPSET